METRSTKKDQNLWLNQEASPREIKPQNRVLGSVSKGAEAESETQYPAQNKHRRNAEKEEKHKLQ
jgi:hypothetical protein